MHITERNRIIARRGIQTYDFTVFSFIGGHLNQLTKALIVKCCMCCGYFVLFVIRSFPNSFFCILANECEAQWGPFGPCSVTCSGGEQIRFRSSSNDDNSNNNNNNRNINNTSNGTNVNLGNKKCAIPDIHPCNQQPCPIGKVV